MAEYPSAVKGLLSVSTCYPMMFYCAVRGETTLRVSNWKRQRGDLASQIARRRKNQDTINAIKIVNLRTTPIAKRFPAWSTNWRGTVDRRRTRKRWGSSGNPISTTTTSHLFTRWFLLPGSLHLCAHFRCILFGCPLVPDGWRKWGVGESRKGL